MVGFAEPSGEFYRECKERNSRILKRNLSPIPQQQERRLFTVFHRQVFCLTDDWYGLSIADIRAIEDKTKGDLDVLGKEEKKRGFAADEE